MTTETARVRELRAGDKIRVRSLTYWIERIEHLGGTYAVRLADGARQMEVEWSTDKRVLRVIEEE